MTSQKKINIGGRMVGESEPCFIVAELGINHNGDIELAKKMIQTAKECGADAIKIQSFLTEEFVSDKDLKYTYKSQGKEITESQYEMFKRYELSKETQKQLFDFAREIGIIIFSTPQDSTFQIVDYLCGPQIDMAAIKVGSDDLTNLRMLSYYAKKGRPIIISTGMATIDEIEDAVRTIKEQGNHDIAILKCTSLYPTPPELCNLNQIKTLQSAFDAVIGYSDHTFGTTAAVVAAVFGAKIIEKHFTLDKKDSGPDHWFSADPAELRELVLRVREAEKMPGISQFVLSDAELKMKNDCRRSVIAKNNIPAGHPIKEIDLELGRPGDGIAPKYMPFLVGKSPKNDLPKGHRLNLNDF